MGKKKRKAKYCAGVERGDQLVVNAEDDVQRPEGHVRDPEETEACSRTAESGSNFASASGRMDKRERGVKHRPRCANAGRQAPPPPDRPRSPAPARSAGPPGSGAARAARLRIAAEHDEDEHRRRTSAQREFAQPEQRPSTIVGIDDVEQSPKKGNQRKGSRR